MDVTMTPQARMNAHGQPIGAAIEGWSPRPRPPRTVMQGRFCRLEPIDLDRHAASLHEANSEDRDGRNWTYLGAEAPADLDAYRGFLRSLSSAEDPVPFAIVDLGSEKPVGIATFMRIDPANGVIEVGNLNYAPRLQRKPAATEAMYLMMRRAFDELGYRRYEWKCDALNLPSRAAAQRLGFSFEGVFRQAVVVKGRNRDTAWFSIVDGEWPALRDAFETWLSPDNFYGEGRQIRGLSEIRQGASPG